MPHIAVDCRFASTTSGLGRYTREIASGLVMQSSGERYTLIVRSRSEEWLRDIQDKCSMIESDINHYSLAEQLQLPAIISATEAQLFFAPHFNVPLRCPTPYVATIHDIILHRYPNEASLIKQCAYRFLMYNTVKNARHLIAISTFVRDELIRTYGMHVGERISRIPQGVDERFAPASSQSIEAVAARYGITQPYFLYVGNAKEHKQVPVLLEAFHAAQLEGVELLLVTGGREADAITSLPPHSRILSNVPDEDLPSLYSGARAVLSASLYEGFCLPVAEALACGAPVIASDTTAIPEVADGRALLISPTVEQFTRAMRTSLPRPQPLEPRHWKDTVAMTRTILLEACV